MSIQNADLSLLNEHNLLKQPSLDLTKQENMLSFYVLKLLTIQISQTGDQSYSDTSP